MNSRDLPAEAELSGESTLACAIRCVSPAGAGIDAARDGFVMDGPEVDSDHLHAAAAIALPVQGAGRAARLLASGARCVLLGEAALRDASIVASLAAEFGKDRVGVYVPARRLAVRWSFDTVSNADFRVLAPSSCAPSWEVLLADGKGTGTLAQWWIDRMLALGASLALLRVDIRDDTDLNLCADCVERFEQRLWIGPLADEAPAISEWIEFGHVRQLALLPALFATHSGAARARAVDSAKEAG